MKDDVTAGIIEMRTLHSYVVDAVLGQDPDTANDITTLLGGLHCHAFQRAVFETGFARIRSAIEDDKLVYLVELHGDDGWLVLVRPPATALGIPDTPELRDREIALHAERLAREIVEDEQ
jgi:hypothetical protein